MTVLRYDTYADSYSSGSMKVDPYGDYVEYEDYEALLKQLTEATLQLNMALRENAGLRESVVEGNVERVWQD